MEGESDDFINLVLSQKLETLSLRVNDEHPGVNETSDVWVSLAVDPFDVSLWLKLSVVSVVIELVVLLPVIVGELLKLVDAIDLVAERLVEVSRNNMHILLHIRDIAVVNSSGVNSVWLVHHLEVVRVSAKSAPFVIVVYSSSGFCG